MFTNKFQNFLSLVFCLSLSVSGGLFAMEVAEGGEQKDQQVDAKQLQRKLEQLEQRLQQQSFQHGSGGNMFFGGGGTDSFYNQKDPLRRMQARSQAIEACVKFLDTIPDGDKAKAEKIVYGNEKPEDSFVKKYPQIGYARSSYMFALKDGKFQTEMANAIGRGISKNPNFQMDPSDGFLRSAGSAVAVGSVEKFMTPVGLEIEIFSKSLLNKIKESCKRTWYLITRGTRVAIKSDDVKEWYNGIDLMTSSLLELAKKFEDVVTTRAWNKRLATSEFDQEEASASSIVDEEWVSQIPLYVGSLDSILEEIDILGVFYKKDKQILFNANLFYKAIEMLKNHIESKKSFEEFSKVESRRNVEMLKAHIYRLHYKLSNLLLLRWGDEKSTRGMPPMSHGMHGHHSRDY